MLAKI